MRETINLKGQEEYSAEQPLPHHAERRERRSKKWIIMIIIVLVVIFGWWAVNGATQWKAVFLTNNQVYFGHFWSIPFAGTIDLHNVYYLEFGSGQTFDSTDQSQLKLVKLGSEIHGPTDEMVIPMSQVLFWETLRSNSAIVTTIKNGTPDTSN